MTLKFWVPFALFVAMAVSFWFGLYKDPHTIDSPLLNKALPEFRAPELNTQASISRANFLGQISMLNVFATWCVPCRNENALLMSIAANHSVQIIGLDYRDEQSTVTEWLKHYGNPYSHIIFDPKGIAAIELGVYGTPETFLIDKEGVIRYKHIGSLSEKDWAREFVPLIKQLEAE